MSSLHVGGRLRKVVTYKSLDNTGADLGGGVQGVHTPLEMNSSSYSLIR